MVQVSLGGSVAFKPCAAGGLGNRANKRRVPGAERSLYSLLLVIQRDRLGQGTSLLGVITYSALFSGNFRR